MTSFYLAVLNSGSKLLTPGQFALTEGLFLRLLGLVYLCAFGSLWPQILGLVGSAGIEPVATNLGRLSCRVRHSCLPVCALPVVAEHWRWLANALLRIGMLGVVALLAGMFSRWAAALCFVLYLSLVSIGQPFTSFQWDALLLEVGFLAIFAGAPLLVWAYRLLLFRLMFESGIVKLSSHDPNWRNLHALCFHFMTQPLPNPLAYYASHAPPWLLDSCTFATFLIELVVPFLLFVPTRRVRQVAVALLMLLQVVIILTGNFAFFNLLTLALCLWGLDDGYFLALTRVLNYCFPRTLVPKSPRLLLALNLAVASLMLWGGVQLISEVDPGLISPRLAQPSFLESFEIVNGYGLFAVMTTTRSEIVLEASDDGVTWKEYSFRYKPGDLHRPLPLIAPYQPRLDWQMWFAALGTCQQNTWVESLMYRLLEGDERVERLMQFAPFGKPRYVRALLYDYAFTTSKERHKTGAIWKRQLLGKWCGPFSLKD